MSIAEKLSWEFVALSDRGNAGEQERLSLEIASGVANLIGDQPELFSACMSSIFEIVPIIPYDEEDEIIHTDEYPLCEDETCPCKQEAV